MSAVVEFCMRNIRYNATCNGEAGSVGMSACLLNAHLFQDKKAPPYFLTVEGALLWRITLGRDSTNSLNSGSSMTAISCHTGRLKVSKQRNKRVVGLVTNAF